MLPRCKYYLETGDTSIFKDEELETLRALLQTDQSGAEALVVAYDCEDKDYRQLFINNVKPHVYIALHLFPEVWPKKARENNISITVEDISLLQKTRIPELKKNPNWKELDLLIKASDSWQTSERYYYFAKQTCHSGNYDIQANTFQMNVLEKSGGKVVLSKEQSREFLEMYRGLFPEIPERNRRIRRQIDEYKVIYNMFGFPYVITSPNISERTYKEYYAWGPQSTVGEITRVAFTQLYHYAEDNHRKWDILADTHDSYLVQCPLLCVRECASKMKEFMAQEFISPIDGVKFRMKSETQIGFNWSPFKESNPVGLREVKWL